MILGAEVVDVDPEQVIDIVRRAVETMQLLSTENQNESFPFWIPTAQQSFGPGGARYFPTRLIHESLLEAVEGLTSTDSARRQGAMGALKQMRRVLRAPRDTWNYSRQADSGEQPPLQQMPALMRSADGGLLALTLRQLNMIDKAIEQFDIPIGGGTAAEAMTRMILDLQSAAALHSAVILPDGSTLSSLFSSPDDLLAYLSDPATVALGQTATDLGFAGQRLIVPGQPANSALLTMVKMPQHLMNGPLASHLDPVLQIDGFAVLELWINSLT